MGTARPQDTSMFIVETWHHNGLKSFLKYNIFMVPKNKVIPGNELGHHGTLRSKKVKPDLPQVLTSDFTVFSDFISI